MQVGSVAHINRTATFGAILGLFVLATAVACYSPSYQDCQLRCATGNSCPDSLRCEDGYCRLGGGQGECNGTQIPDASSQVADADPDQPDADPEAPDADVIDAGGPIDAPADAGIDAGCTCNPLDQGACCEAGQACDFSAPGSAPTCRAADPMGNQGAICEAAIPASVEVCAVGFTCMDDPATSAMGGTCHEFCTDDVECIGVGSLCQNTVPGTDVQVCSTNCNPIGAVGCPPQGTCVVTVAPGERVFTDCFLRGTGDQGVGCEGHDDCARGHFCKTGEGAAYCSEYCDRNAGGNQGCNGGSKCTDLVIGGVTLGNLEVGYCKRP